MNDIAIIRKLAGQYATIANEDKNREKIILHKNVNDLKQTRPVILIDEIPWHEMNIDNELTLQCENAEIRVIEDYFRKQLYWHRHLRADRVFLPYYPVYKVIHSNGIGLEIEEKRIDSAIGGVSSHAYEDQLQIDNDIEKLHNSVITYDYEETRRQFQFAGDLFGDILPVKISGVETGYGLAHKLWDIVSTLKGVTNLMIDLAERPEFMHKLAEKLTDILINTMRQYEELNLLDPAPLYNHCTCASTNDLPAPDDLDHVRLKNVWGRGLAQIFASVSPSMHEEFDIQYAKKALAPFGLVYYGCCEPLDKKIDLLRQIPNLRKISITPWANVDVAAEAIGKDYVVASKPNPSIVAVSSLDEDALRCELKRIFDACRRNNCSCDLVLKDISTVSGNPQNLFRWEQIAMEMVKNY